MSPFAVRRTRRARRARPAARRNLHLESLEPRAMLAISGGNVKAELFGSTLVLTGDDAGNQVIVASVAGGGVAVGGNNTTINGSTNPFVTTKKVVNIVANMNGGNDVIGFGNSAAGFAAQLDEYEIIPPFDVVALQNAIDAVDGGASEFAIPGSLTITTAGGGDLVGILGTVGGSVVANLGSAPAEGYNAFIIGYDDPPVVSTVRGSVTVVGGAQKDAASLLGTVVRGSVVASLGDGDDFFDTSELRVRRDVSVVTAGGDDEVFLHCHDDLPATVVGGTVAVDTGLGDDLIEIESDIGKVLSVVSGGGNDEILVAETSVGINAVINAGGDEDLVGLGDVQVRYNLFVYLEGANDVLSLADVRTRNAFLYGGLGENTLNIDNASRSGIRTLRYYQFQTVTTIV